MTPEEQKQFVELQDKLKAAEAERDAVTTKLAERDKDLTELQKINQQLFLRATTPAAPPASDDKDDEDETPAFTTNDLIKSLKK